MLLPFQHRKSGIWQWHWGYLECLQILAAGSCTGVDGRDQDEMQVLQGKELPQVLLGASPAALEQIGNFLVQTWKANTGQGPGKHLIPGHALWLLARGSGCWHKPCQGDLSQEAALIRQLSLLLSPGGTTGPLLSSSPAVWDRRGFAKGSTATVPMPLLLCARYP